MSTEHTQSDAKKKRNLPSKFRIYHRYLGFFLAGIMSIYALSGVVMIFRTTDFLKKEKQMERQLEPNVPAEELGRQLFIRNLEVVEETGDQIRFREGSYDKTTGLATYTVKELPTVIQKLEGMHKATVNRPMFFLNIFFGVSLLFFSLSSFFMFMPGSTVLRKGLYFALGGLVLAVVMVLL
ncbi:MAG: hypothetical protein R2751_11605 [Bacteroidales bacterium]